MMHTPPKEADKNPYSAAYRTEFEPWPALMDLYDTEGRVTVARRVPGDVPANTPLVDGDPRGVRTLGALGVAALGVAYGIVWILIVAVFAAVTN